MNAFEQLGLRTELCEAVSELGFETPTEIQQKAIPELVQGNRDFIGLAQTGTGKTAAFGLPLLEQFEPQKLPFALILAPTRELCLQITKELKLFSKNLNHVRITAIYGGSSVSKQRKELERGVDVIVATPGRLLDFIRRGAARLQDLRVAVLDEADEMLQMGFIDDIKTILAETPVEKQTWLFSATMPNAIAGITKKFMTDPFRVQVGKRNQGAQNVEHAYYLTRNEHKFMALRRLLDAAASPYGIVFCNTKRDTQQVADQLLQNNYTAAALHGDLSQQQRDLVMNAFRQRLVSVLVATDVAARGIDVDDVTHVFHYGVPNDAESYTHRSGRTGRAGRSGESWILANKKESLKIPQLQKQIGKTIHKRSFPTGQEVCKSQLNAFASRVAATKADVGAVEEYMDELLPLFANMSKEEVVQYFLAEEFDALFRHYEQAVDLNVVTEQNPKKEYRYRINLGERDGFTWPMLKDFLREAAGLRKYAVEGVEVYSSKSEFSIDVKEENKLLEAIDGAEWEGRTIRLTRLGEAAKMHGGAKRNKRFGGNGRSKKSKGHRKGGNKKRRS
jgi:ATP-dependent RNA helicase DeaD